MVHMIKTRQGYRVIVMNQEYINECWFKSKGMALNFIKLLNKRGIK